MSHRLERELLRGQTKEPIRQPLGAALCLRLRDGKEHGLRHGQTP
ncbi:MAG: hypothetical protein AAF690_05125 [Acidobacteriota bacterium]